MVAGSKRTGKMYVNIKYVGVEIATEMCQQFGLYYWNELAVNS